MAAKVQLLVVAISVFASLGVNDSQFKNLILDPSAAQEVAAAFQDALKEEEPLLEEERQGVSLLRTRTHLRSSKSSPVVPMPSSGESDTGVWESDFEKDVMDMVMGLSKNGMKGTPFGGSVEKIINVIQNDMMPEVEKAHTIDQDEVNRLANDLKDTCGPTMHTEVTSANVKKTAYVGHSGSHKECRSEEESMYNENVQCHKDWREAKEEKILKCQAYVEVQNKYGEQNTNNDIVKKAASEDVETYVRRISETICGTPLDCSSCPGGSGGGSGGSGGDGGGSIGFLDDLLAHKKGCEDATAHYNDLTTKCKNLDHTWHEKRKGCDNIQEQMDQSSCNWATETKDACEAYMSCYLAKKSGYDTNHDTVKLQEVDRKAEWKGLKRMLCIIDAFKDMKVEQAEIDVCKAQNHTTDHLNVKYPEHGTPALPAEETCTVPNLYPATADYKIAEFDPLPAVARGRMDAFQCGLNEVSTTPAAGSPTECKCVRVTMNGPFSPGALVKCTDCIDVRKSTEDNSCPIGTKIFSPQSRQDWDTFIKSASPLKDPNWIVDVTHPEDGCDGCVTSGVDVPIMNSAHYGDGVSLRKRWVTSDGSPWWLRATQYDQPQEGGGTALSPTGNYHANCYLDLSSALSGDDNFANSDSVTFDDKNCDYHSKSYYCQSKQASLTPKDGSPEGCVCKRVQLTGEYSASILIKCEKCLDVYKSLDKNSCPSGTKLFSPRTRGDWKTFLASAGPLRSPHWIIDVTRPQNGCGGCTDNVMNSGVPAQATWSTSDGSPWWLRDTLYSQPNGDYEANCFMDLSGTPENENSITFDDDTCNIHSRSYYCQSLKTTTTTTTTTEPPPVIEVSEATTNWDKDGRTVYLFKTSKGVDVRTETSFCTNKGLKWWTPLSQDDAQTLITNAYNNDKWHTWIQLYNVQTANGKIGGYSVTVDSPSCVGTCSSEWCAIRKWGCSMCDTASKSYKSCCWDTSHPYDWFVCST